MRVAVLEARKADAAQPVHGEFGRLPLRSAEKDRTDHHVVEHGLPREQRVGLEHVADALCDAVDDVTADLHGAGARRFEAGHLCERR